MEKLRIILFYCLFHCKDLMDIYLVITGSLVLSSYPPPLSSGEISNPVNHSIHITFTLQAILSGKDW